MELGALYREGRKKITQFFVCDFCDLIFLGVCVREWKVSCGEKGIESYVKQQASKWVVEGGIEKEWDSYKETLKNMGLDEFMKIQQEAYNRYQKEVKE